MDLNDDMQAAAPERVAAEAVGLDNPSFASASGLPDMPALTDPVAPPDMAPAMPSEPSVPAIPVPASPWSGARIFIRETVETIALTLIIFLVIRAGVQNFRIEGQSMEPNFHDGQYLLVSKIDYMIGKPQRGDVVVFIAPTNQEKDFIKRVIGLPGETVEIRDGRITINGRELPQNYTVNTGTYSYGPVKVGDEELFVLGDNRNYSSDSHSWGMLPQKDLIGKAWVSYWPPPQWGIIQTPSFGDVAASPGAPARQTTPLPGPTIAAYPTN
ncbi:MAG: signal peptidase I [Chloroflexi bacterium]|nr:signal peptidase I [Chloroflexota bacterium]